MTLGFEKLVNFGVSETRVGSEINARDFVSISRHNRLQHALPAVGGVDVAGSQRAAFQIAKLIEQEQRMVAGAGIVAIPGTHLLLTVGGADARIQVEHDAARRA